MRMDIEGCPYESYPTLNEARAAIVRLTKEGKLDGGIIFKPYGFGTMITNVHDDRVPLGTLLYTGYRAEFRPVNEDGSLMPEKEYRKLMRGF